MALIEGRRIGIAVEGEEMTSWLLAVVLLFSSEVGLDLIGEGTVALAGLAGRTKRSARLPPGGDLGRLDRIGGVC